MVKIFNKGLDEEEDKKEGLLKRLKNIENKNEQLLKPKNKTENIKEVTDLFKEPLRPEAKALSEEIRTIQKDVNYRKLIIRDGDNSTNDFIHYKTFNELFRDLYYKKMTINDTEIKQDEFDSMLGVLSNFILKTQKYIEAKYKLLDNVKKFYEGEKKLLTALKIEYFR